MTTPVAGMTAEQLLQTLVTQLQSNPSSSTFARPQPFLGTDYHDGRRFLSQFESWAKEKADLQADEQKKIRAALQLFQGATATSWSTGPMNAMTSGTPPWTTWEAFKKDFTARWLPPDEARLALAQLEKLKQGPKESVNHYASAFTDLAGRTDLEDHGKRAYFLRGLNQFSRLFFTLADQVAPDTAKATSFLDTVTRARGVDALDTQASTSVLSLLGFPTAAPAAPAVDPFAMDVDVIAGTQTQGAAGGGKTKADYQRAMRGRCFGCGGGDHSRSTGNCRAKGVKCNYCKRPNHYEIVCEDKFCGRPRNRGGARVAATTTSDFTLFPGETGLQGLGQAPATIAATTTAPATAAAPALAASPGSVTLSQEQLGTLLPVLIAAAQQGF